MPLHRHASSLPRALEPEQARSNPNPNMVTSLNTSNGRSGLYKRRYEWYELAALQGEEATASFINGPPTNKRRRRNTENTTTSSRQQTRHESVSPRIAAQRRAAGDRDSAAFKDMQMRLANVGQQMATASRRVAELRSLLTQALSDDFSSVVAPTPQTVVRVATSAASSRGSSPTSQDSSSRVRIDELCS